MRCCRISLIGTHLQSDLLIRRETRHKSLSPLGSYEIKLRVSIRSLQITQHFT
jgi:hypothetical protein